MSLVIYGHPLSPFTQKVLIALYENDTPFELRRLGPDSPQNVAEWLRLWPLRRFPVLLDGARSVIESSIIIEYLQIAYPGPVRLLPIDPMAALEIRFLDRFFDLHVMLQVTTAMQYIADDTTAGDALKRQDGLASAVEKLDLAYAWLDRQLAGKQWAAGDDFTMADCAAAPALFYADWTHQISENFPALRAYRARLLARPAFARAVDEARPFRSLLPVGGPDRD